MGRQRRLLLQVRSSWQTADGAAVTRYTPRRRRGASGVGGRVEEGERPPRELRNHGLLVTGQKNGANSNVN